MYKFFLDNTLITDENIKWADAKIGYKRSEKFNALFFKYASDFTFIGDAYQYFIDKRDTYGHCATVQLRIDYREDASKDYDTLFEGQIRLRDISPWDEFYRQITCNAEDNSLTEQFLKFIDTQFDVGSGKSALPPVNNPATLRKISVTNEATSTPFVPVFGYFMNEVLQSLLDQMTQSQITLASNYFSTQTKQRQLITLEFTNTAQITGVGTFGGFAYTNYFGVQVINPAVPKHATVAAVLDEELLSFRAQVDGDPILDYYVNDWTKVPKVTHDGVSKLFLEFDAPVDISTFIMPSGVSVTATETQVIADGMKKLFITDGTSLRGSAPCNVILSFSELWEELNKQFCLGMSIKRSGTAVTCTIEPLSFFFSTSTNITLDSVPELQYTVSDRYAKDRLKVGDGRDKKKAKSQADLITAGDWVTSASCNSASQDVKNKFSVDYQDVQAQINMGADDANDDKYYLIECEDTGLGGFDGQAINFSDYQYTDNVGGFEEAEVMNAHLTNYWKVRRWTFLCIGDMTFNSKVIKNEYVPRLIRAYQFEYPLTYSQLKQITLGSGELNYIIFRDTNNPADNRYGWIEEIETPLEKKITNFNLITI